MKRIIKTVAFVMSALAVAGCAKAVQTGPNEANERYFNAWIGLNHPGISPTGLGIYVIEEEAGTGSVVKEGGYIYADYKITDLEGNISSYTDKETAKQLGDYDTTKYYGAKVLTTTKNTIYAGLADAVIGMKTGGRKKVIIPSWLMTYASYDSKEDYLNKNTSGANTIYDITVRDFTDSIQLYEIGLIEKYIKDHPNIFDNRIVNDTTGFYYQTLTKGLLRDETFEKDTTIYINYTGRLLNGLVFDTTIEKVAKDNGLYSSSRTYGPTQVKWSKNVADITLGSSSSSVIDGFARTIQHMRPMEKGLGIFYSPLGYSYNGSGASIPGYSPLIFEIEIVAKPED